MHARNTFHARVIYSTCNHDTRINSFRLGSSILWRLPVTRYGCTDVALCADVMSRTDVVCLIKADHMHTHTLEAYCLKHFTQVLEADCLKLTPIHVSQHYNHAHCMQSQLQK